MAGADPWEYQTGPSYPSSPYPVTSIGNALANAIDAWGAKRAKTKYSQSLANALAPQPVDQVAVTPNLTSAPASDTVQSRTMAGAYNQPSERDIFSKLLDTGNPDVTAQFGPLALQSQIQSQAQANAPITPYQRANLGREQQATEASIANQVAQRKAQEAQNAEQTRIHDPAYLASVAGSEAAAKYPWEKQLADIRANAQLGSSGNVQSVQPVYDRDGKVSNLVKVYRNGKVETVDLGGKPVISAQTDPAAVYDRNAGKAAGTVAGTAAANQPTVDGSYQMMKDTLKSFQDPTVKKEAGNALNLVGSNLPTIPGVNSNFISHLQQLQGQTFLQAYNSLKGGGAITDTEGAKATVAIARLQRAQTTDEFYKSLSDAETEIDKLYSLAKSRAGRGMVVPQQQGGAQPQVAPQASPAMNNDPLGLR